jgi:hypothetical protein
VQPARAAICVTHALAARSAARYVRRAARAGAHLASKAAAASASGVCFGGAALPLQALASSTTSSARSVQRVVLRAIALRKRDGAV